MDQKLTGRKRVLYLLFVAVFLFVMVSPMLYMISASFMPESDLNHIPPRILPSAGTIKTMWRRLCSSRFCGTCLTAL